LVGIWIACVFGFILRNLIFNHIRALVKDDDDLQWYGKAPLITLITAVAMSSVAIQCGVGYWTHHTNTFIDKFE
jgi:hypothetical protein